MSDSSLMLPLVRTLTGAALAAIYGHPVLNRRLSITQGRLAAGDSAAGCVHLLPRNGDADERGEEKPSAPVRARPRPISGVTNDETAQQGAFKSFFITGGGIAVLGGLLFVGAAAGDTNCVTILRNDDMLRASLLYDVMLGLVAFGAFTKSAPPPVHIIAICPTMLGGAPMTLAASGQPRMRWGKMMQPSIQIDHKKRGGHDRPNHLFR